VFFNEVIGHCIFLVISSAEHAMSQNAYFKLGQQAYIDGNFKAAITQLEKGRLIDSTDANALWMLGYSYTIAIII